MPLSSSLGVHLPSPPHSAEAQVASRVGGLDRGSTQASGQRGGAVVRRKICPAPLAHGGLLMFAAGRRARVSRAPRCTRPRWRRAPAPSGPAATAPTRSSTPPPTTSASAASCATRGRARTTRTEPRARRPSVSTAWFRSPRRRAPRCVRLLCGGLSAQRRPTTLARHFSAGREVSFPRASAPTQGPTDTALGCCICATRGHPPPGQRDPRIAAAGVGVESLASAAGEVILGMLSTATFNPDGADDPLDATACGADGPVAAWYAVCSIFCERHMRRLGNRRTALILSQTAHNRGVSAVSFG